MVTNDNTFPFDGHRFQIPPGPKRRSYAKAKVDVWQHLDGQLEVRYQGQSLVTFMPTDKWPVRVEKFSPAAGQEAPEKEPEHQPKRMQPKERKPYKPADNHPWRKS